jgi:hypothetical protein
MGPDIELDDVADTPAAVDHASLPELRTPIDRRTGKAFEGLRHSKWVAGASEEQPKFTNNHGKKKEWDWNALARQPELEPEPETDPELILNAESSLTAPG